MTNANKSLHNLVAAREKGFELVSDRPRIDDILERTRACGYGQRFGEEPVESGAIAVPVLGGRHVLGCVTMTFIRRGMRPQDAASRCLSAMKEAAEQIAAGAAQTVARIACNPAARGMSVRAEFRAGWRNLAAATVGLGFGVPSYTAVSGLFFQAIRTEFGWSSAATAGALVALPITAAVLPWLVG